MVSGQPSEVAQRKVYFTDPLLARLASIIDEQRSAPTTSKLSEQQIGLTLSCAIDRRSPGSFILGTRLMYLRTGSGKEIDFVSPDFEGCFAGKYVDHGWKSEARVAKAQYENGLLATRRAHDRTDRSWATPAASPAWLIDSKP